MNTNFINELAGYGGLRDFMDHMNELKCQCNIILLTICIQAQWTTFFPFSLTLWIVSLSPRPCLIREWILGFLASDLLLINEPKFWKRVTFLWGLRDFMDHMNELKCQ